MRFRNATCKREGILVQPSECVNDEAAPIALNETCTGLGPCNSISVVRPHGGESLRRNRVLNVEWQHFEGLQQNDDIYIDLYNSSGFVRRIGDVFPPTTMYSWKISTDVGLGADYFVLVYTPHTSVRHEGRSVNFAIMGEAELSISAGLVFLDSSLCCGDTWRARELTACLFNPHTARATEGTSAEDQRRGGRDSSSSSTSLRIMCERSSLSF